jgi:hypothetical protein
MAYGLKYTITQLLRDETLLKVEIHEKDYTGALKTYEAVSINLESNSSGDEPLPSIISSQLNVSFIVSEADSAVTFPDLLSFDDRKYFVKLYNGVTLLWSGFLFNDYVSLPFTTGFVQVDIVAIDGLSLLEYSQFNNVDSISVNSLIRIIDVISQCINIIDYPDPISMITSCSYYAEGMFDRGDATGDEPFSQSYIYLRDLQGKTYYEVLENIVSSFGCRLFQSDGQWQILAINEMAQATRYYTQYFLYPTVSVGASGILDESVNIAPYANGNVHFINNEQSKIVRKGYPKLVHNYSFEYPDNYIHNGTLKGLYNRGLLTNLPYGWYYKQSFTGPISGNIVDVIPDSEFNEITLTVTGGRDNTVFLQNTPDPFFLLDDKYYLPYMVGPSFTFSFEYQMFSPNGKVEIACIVGSTTYYYNEIDKTWGTTQRYVNYEQAPESFLGVPFVSFSLNVLMSYPAIPFAFGQNWGGFIRVKFFVGDTSSGFSDTTLRNIKITQNNQEISSIEVTRQVGTGNTNVKTTSQPYASFVYLRLATSLINTNNLGVLYNSTASPLKNWYRYPRTETFLLLQMLIARQFSNLINKNFGTLEAELGKFKTNKGLNYLDKVYTLTDSTSNVLSYNNKKFLMNRGSITPRVDEVNSFQIIEITDQDNTSTETIKYIE